MILGLTITITLFASLLSTWIVEHALAHRIAIVGSFAGFELAHNRGIAFSIAIPSPWQEVVIIAALILVVVIALRSPRSFLSSVAFGLIIAGALGNLIDRIVDGLVTDFIQIGSFPIFNIADSAITIGAALLILDSFLVSRRQSPH